MVHIGQFIGSIRSQNKKMEHSKEKCGKMPLDTSAIGETIARKVSVYNSTKMAINMKACGPWIRSMVRALIGEVKAPSYAGSTQGIGSRIRSMAEGHSFLKIAIDMMGIGSMACHKGRAE